MQGAEASLRMTCPVTRDQTRDKSMTVTPSTEMLVAHPARGRLAMETRPSVNIRITRELVRVDGPVTKGDATMMTIRQTTDPTNIKPSMTKTKETLPWTQS